MIDTTKNFRQLIPCIRVKDVKATLEYYVYELGFKPRYYLNGTPESGGVEINGISIDFISGDMDYSDVSLNFLVDNIDSLYSKYNEKELDIILKPRTTNGMSLFGIRDINQYRLFFYNWTDNKRRTKSFMKTQAIEIPERFKNSLIKSAAEAVKDGDLEVLKKILSLDSSIASERIQDPNGSNTRLTLLHLLADPLKVKLCDKSADIAHTLIKSGCLVDSLDRIETGKTPLQLLLSKPRKDPHIIDIVKVLMNAGARIDDSLKNESGINAFYYAILNAFTRVASLMLSKVKRPGFIWMAGLGNYEIVKGFFASRDSQEFNRNSKYFLFEETSTNYSTKRNMLTLSAAYILACINGQNEVIELLLNEGVDINTTATGKILMIITATGLHWAAYHGHTDTVDLLLKSGANPLILDYHYSLTPSAWAAKGGNYEIAYYLKNLVSNYK